MQTPQYIRPPRYETDRGLRSGLPARAEKGVINVANGRQIVGQGISAKVVPKPFQPFVLPEDKVFNDDQRNYAFLRNGDKSKLEINNKDRKRTKIIRKKKKKFNS